MPVVYSQKTFILNRIRGVLAGNGEIHKIQPRNMRPGKGTCSRSNHKSAAVYIYRPCGIFIFILTRLCFNAPKRQSTEVTVNGGGADLESDLKIGSLRIISLGV